MIFYNPYLKASDDQAKSADLQHQNDVNSSKDKWGKCHTEIRKAADYKKAEDKSPRRLTIEDLKDRFFL